MAAAMTGAWPSRNASKPKRSRRAANASGGGTGSGVSGGVGGEGGAITSREATGGNGRAAGRTEGVAPVFSAPVSPPPGAPHLRKALHPVDQVHACFYGFVLLVSLVRVRTLPTPAATFGWYGGALVVTLALASALRGRTGFRAMLPRTAWTIVAAPVSFLMLGGVVPYVNPFHGERLLKAADDAMFLGHNPNVMLDRMAWPPLTEILQINYSLYYFIPLILLVAVIATKNADGLARGLFLVVLCLYASYVGYFLVPATGPNINRLGLYPPHFSEPMPGVWMAERIRAALLEAEAIKHDCWPSGHTALSWTCLVLARHLELRWAFWVLLPAVVALIFSTMYLRYHYVIDVVSGFVLAWAVLRYGPRLYERTLSFRV